MKRSDAFPSKYISKDDVTVPLVGIIETVRFDSIKSDDGDESKPSLYFSNGVKPLILNNTNWMIIEDALGPESDDWKGHSIELYCDPTVMFAGKRVGGVRVRAQKQSGPQWTVETAGAIKTLKGTLLGELSAEQLRTLISASNDETRKSAAQFLLEARAEA